MTHHPLQARDAVRGLRASKIREVANAGIGRATTCSRSGSASPTKSHPRSSGRPAIDALDAGETFYTHNLGIAELREAIASYVTRLHRPTGVDAIAVTNSGMSALMLVTQALIGPGDRVVAVTPLWPNLVEIPKILGAKSSNAWSCNSDAKAGRSTSIASLPRSRPATRAVYINSPNNPTGWTLDARGSSARSSRIAGGTASGSLRTTLTSDSTSVGAAAGSVAPSFLDLSQPDDRVISTNTFSKSWLMTGWRLGWIVAPPHARSGSREAPRVQHVVRAAVRPARRRRRRERRRAGDRAHGRPAARARATFCMAISRRTPGVEAVAPPGAMYAFFRVANVTDSLEFCKRLVADAGLGLAPGIAFGPEGEGFVRWCFASSESRLADGVGRLQGFLARYCAT